MGHGDTGQKPAEMGLFVQPLGGCNADDVGSNCIKLTHGWHGENGLHGDCVLIGLGAHPVRPAPGGLMQKAPDIVDLLNPRSPQKLRAIFLHHGHSDEDEGIVRYLEHGYRLPPIYGDELTINIQKEKLRSRVHKGAWPHMYVIAPGQEVELGGFKVEAVPMGHTLSSSGFVIAAAGRKLFFTGDFKLDQTMLTPATDLARLDRMGATGEIDALFLDSTRSGKSGAPVLEADIRTHLKEIADRHPHHRINVVIETGNAEAIARAGWLAAQTSRVAVHHGCQIEHRLRAMGQSGMDLPRLTGNRNLIVKSGPTQLAGKLSPSYVLNILAGINGEPSSVLNRLSRGAYEHAQIGPQDIFIFSGAVKPWHATRLEENIRLLQQRGVEHIYRDGPGLPALDATGHEHGAGQLQLAARVKPRHAVVGVFGSVEQRDACRQLFNEGAGTAIPMVVDNGTILHVSSEAARLIGHEERPLVEIPVRRHPAQQRQAELKVA